MKFALTLEEGQINEWKNMYIDYVSLKKTIINHKEVFEIELKQNLKKIDKFFLKQETILIDYKEHVLSFVNDKPYNKNDFITNQEDLDIIKNEDNDLYSIVIEENIINHSKKDKITEIKKNKKINKNGNNSLLKKSEEKKKGFRFFIWENIKKRNPLSKNSVRKRKAVLLLYIRECYKLKNFAFLNYTGFEKITKKYEKTHNELIKERILNEVKKCYFKTSKKVDELIKELKAFYTILFESNDKKKSKVVFQKLLGLEQPNMIFSFLSGMLLGISLFIIHLIDFGDNFSLYSLFITCNGFFFGTILFGLCMIIFKIHHVNYEYIFNFDVKSCGNTSSYFLLVSILTFSYNGFFYINYQYNLDSNPLIIFIFIFFLLIVPIRYVGKSARFYFLRTLLKIMCSPFFPVEFRHFYLTDCLLSFSYCYRQIFIYFSENEKSLIIPIILCLFPIIRMMQCVRRHFDSRKNYLQLINCGKYTFSCAFIIATYIHFHKNTLITCIQKIIIGIVATVYSIYWDLYMDWGITQKKRIFSIYVSFPILLYNLICRFLWIIPYETKNKCIILSFCEILRRFLWSLLRVEYEHLNNCRKMKSLSCLGVFAPDLFYKEDNSPRIFQENNENDIKIPIDENF